MRKGLKRAVDEGYKKHIGERINKKKKEDNQTDDSPKGRPEKGSKERVKEIKRTILVLPKSVSGEKKVWYKNPVLWILAAVIIGAIVFQLFSKPATTEITLGEAVNHVKSDEVEEVRVDASRAVIKLTSGETVYAVVPSKDGFREALVEAKAPQAKVSYVEDTGSWIDIVSTLIYVVMIGGMVFFVFSLSRSVSKSGSGLLGMGKSKAGVWMGKRQKVTFKDVAGVEEAIEEVNEIVEFLKSPRKFIKLGARIPKGVLVIGPPGTGKTLMARAIAGEANVPFFFTSGSEFEEMLVGAGASRVRDLFEKAKKAAPAIIFIDEMDAVGRKRGTVLHTGTAEQTLNQILVEMDGFDKTTNVIVIAATNRPDVLDPALLRPGRFDRIIALDLPDIGARKEIMKVHAANKPFAKDVDFDRVARRTVGFSGADLENVLNESAILAARRNKEEISMDEIVESITKVQLGPAKKRVQSAKEKEMIAYHEAGHAIVSHFVPGSDDVLKISIVSRGMSLGATEKLPKEEHERIRTKSKIEADITSLVAGHVAEKIAFGETTTGAEHDIKQATKFARAMVSKYGMSELGPIEFQEGDEANKYLGFDYSRRPFSEKTAAAVDDQVSKIVDSAYQKAEEILTKHREELDKVVEALLDKESLGSEEFGKILGE